MRASTPCRPEPARRLMRRAARRWEGGIRPASFVYSPLLPSEKRGKWYNGTLHETDWFKTFLHVAARSTNASALEIELDGLDIWEQLQNVDAPNSTREVLIADNVLRQGEYKLIAGGFHNEDSHSALLMDCMLGTDGGWMTPPNGSDNVNRCPLDVYTRPPANAKKGASEIGCDKDSGAGVIVSSDIDKQLCSETLCTLAAPCLFNVITDPQERHDVSAEFPNVVQDMLKRLKAYSANFYAGTGNMIKDNGKFCDKAAERGNFIGPWLD